AREGGVNLADIPAESIERIEVLKGGASSLYGADAVGGVIVITTKRGGDRRLAVTAENKVYPAALGSDLEYLAAAQRLAASLDTRIGAAGFSASGSFERAGDSFPAAQAGGAVLERGNAGFLGGSGSLGLEAPALGGILSAALSGRYADFGVPGSASFPSPNAEQRNRDLRGTAAWSSDALLGGRLVLNASAFGAWSRLEYEDPDWLTDDRHDTLSAGADLRARFLAAEFLEIPAGLEFRYDGAESTKVGNPRRYHAGAYAAPVLAVGQAVKVSPSVRFDWYDDYPAGFTYSLGASAAVSEAVTLKATAGRSYRAPAFNDLYWPYSSYYDPNDAITYITLGNGSLKPETSWYGEIGGEASRGVYKVSIFGFARYSKDLIIWDGIYDVPTSTFTFLPDNLSAAAFFGADTEASLQSGPLSVSAYYALLLSYDLSSGNTLADEVRVANQPVHTVRLESSYSFGTIKVLARTSWKSEYDDPFGNTLHPAVLLGARIQYEATDSMLVYLDGENLLNQAYAEMDGYPMPGITLKAGVRIVL
ncbi:MAG: TonB-dependent receptor, partial [Treponema sp.]|nr:TonB-dependent receptor [Treponema sp.]